MLIQLSVKNFKSIRDEQIVDFFSQKKKKNKNAVSLEDTSLQVFRAIALIGANAAGKSTFLEALEAIRKSILNRHFTPDRGVSFYQPHILSSETQTAPTCFELEFSLPKKVNSLSPHYIYSLEYNASEILQESLHNISIKKRKATTCLYSRKQGDTDKTMRFSTLLPKGKKRIPFFSNQTYLSVLRMTPDAVPELRLIAQYLCGEFKLEMNDGIKQEEGVSHLDLAKRFLPYADVGISDVFKKKSALEALPFSETERNEIDDDFLRKMEKVLQERDYYYFEHQGQGNYRSEIWFENESTGTKSFFMLLPKIVTVLKTGTTWICDELGDQLHPYLIMLLIQLFNDSTVNVNNAQILFTTQNLSFLEQNLLSKEQIWLVEKREGASFVFSLADFDDSNNVDLSKWYLDGRFGGIPQIDYFAFAEKMREIL